MHSLKSSQNGQIFKDQQEKLTEIKTFCEYLYGQKNNAQDRTEIDHSPVFF